MHQHAQWMMFYYKDKEHFCVFLLLNHLTDLPFCICFFSSRQFVFISKISLQKLLIDGLHSDRISTVFFSHIMLFYFYCFCYRIKTKISIKAVTWFFKSDECEKTRSNYPVFLAQIYSQQTERSSLSTYMEGNGTLKPGTTRGKYIQAHLCGTQSKCLIRMISA